MRTSPAIQQFNKRTGQMESTGGAVTEIPVQTVVGEIDGTDDDGRAVMKTGAAMLTRPQTGDTLVQGDFTYTIGTVNVVAPQGYAVVYIAEVE